MKRLPIVAAILAGAVLVPSQAAAAGKTKPKTLSDLAGQQVTLPPDTPITDAENRARENYRQFLELSNTDPKRAAEALRRLGDLELEAGETNDLNRGVDRLRAETYAKAVGLYQKLLKDHPDFPRNDLVLYQLSRAQESGGEPLAALATLDRLIAQFPKTPLLDEVQFRRGEILFAHERYEHAERAYTAVLALDAKSAFHEQALYKLGWSQFKQDRYDEDLATFLKLLDGRLAGIPAADVDRHIESLSRPVRELLDDTLRVMSLSFSYLEGEKTMRQTLHAHQDPEYGHLLYLSLAAQYLEEKRYVDSAAVLTGFVDAQPLHPRAPYLTMQAVASLGQGKFPDEVFAARERFVNRFGLDQPFWNAQKPEDHPQVIAFLQESVWTLAQVHHAAAQDKAANKAERDRNYQLAAEGYRRYLAYFPQDPKAAESQFLLGEVLFESSDYANAVTAYEATAYDYPAHARSAEAGYASLLAYQRHETSLSGDDKTQWHRRFVDAELRFASTFPDDSHAVAARVDAAEGLYTSGALDAAIAAAEPATTAGDANLRRVAWLVLGHAHFDSGRFDRAEAAYREVQQIDTAANRRDADLSERIAASIYRQAEQARDAGQPEQAAAAFLRVAQAAPDSKIRATADYDAAQAYLAAGNTAAAVPVLENYRREHPKSPLVNAVTASLALAYAQLNNPAAATEFERIANTPELAAAERQEALRQAAKQFAAHGDDSNEGRVLAAYIKRYPDAFDDNLEATQRLTDLAAKRHDDKARVDGLKQLIALDAGAGAKRTPRSRFLAGRATLALTIPTRDAFLAIPLKAPLKTSLKAKRAKMEEALTMYGKAADYGVAEVLTEATFQIGEIYSGLAKALYASEKPKGLDAEAREQYDVLLQEQAFPFEEKAIELHEANAKRARDGIYDEWVRASFQRLATLVPGRYARPEKVETHVDAIR